MFCATFQVVSWSTCMSPDRPNDTFYLDRNTPKAAGFLSLPLDVTQKNFVSNVCKEAGIQGFKMDQSLQATTSTRLYEFVVDKQLVMERTGHRSIEGIRNYNGIYCTAAGCFWHLEQLKTITIQYWPCCAISTIRSNCFTVINTVIIHTEQCVHVRLHRIEQQQLFWIIQLQLLLWHNLELKGRVACKYYYCCTWTLCSVLFTRIFLDFLVL